MIEEKYIQENTVGDARDRILKYVWHNKDKKAIYLDGWFGVGVTGLLRSLAQALPSAKAPPEICFDKTIYIDCSVWKSRRVMQRKIAEALKLDHTIMAMFDKQDEEDDFNGMEHGSRDVISSVSAAIDLTLRDSKFAIIFLNGSGDEVDFSRFGIPEYRDYILIWTFKPFRRRFNMDMLLDLSEKFRYTHVFMFCHSSLTNVRVPFANTWLRPMLREDAASVVSCYPRMQDIDQTVVTDCCLYELFLHLSFHAKTGFHWAAHAPNYWACDGVVQEGIAREISEILQEEISRLCENFTNYTRHANEEVPCFVVTQDDAHRNRMQPYRWISIATENVKAHEDMQTTLAGASSFFLTSKRSDDPLWLPIGLFKHCSNLGVLVLSCCAFSFVSPPFLCCLRLRFLGVDNCTHDGSFVEFKGDERATKWAHLHGLWVLDIRYTEWNEILSEEKMDLMANLTELNIEGLHCWQYISQLQGRLPSLQRLRIIKPERQADTSTDISDSFMDRTKLQTLDFSGNSDMENLPTGLSKASSLQVLVLDGCDQLESIVMRSEHPSLLRSFSFDGYGPASQWSSSVELPPESSRRKRQSNADEKAVKISKICLQGCSQLENLFLRGLPNLVELDLSGSAIKVLDLHLTVDFPMLKRLFLLGCEHLRAIRWGFEADGDEDSVRLPELELLCVDTRPSRATILCTRPSLANHKFFRLQVHAVLASARLARSLWSLVNHYSPDQNYLLGNPRRGTTRTELVYMNIQITSSSGPEATGKIGGAAATPMQEFPSPPNPQPDRHIQVGPWSRPRVKMAELDETSRGGGLYDLLKSYAQSLHVHDVSASAAAIPGGIWYTLRWCRVERCPNMDTVFPAGAGHFCELETIWASDLLSARCVVRRSARFWDPRSFGNLRHLSLRSCPRLQFALPVWVRAFPRLETLHAIHCGDLRHVFALDERYPAEVAAAGGGLPFPKLATIHLHDLPSLQQICEVRMLAPALDAIRVRGCFGLRRLPTVAAAGDPGAKKPAVEIEKDVWEALEWDGRAAGHHPDLFQPPVHSRYFKRRLLRGGVLR